MDLVAAYSVALFKNPINFSNTYLTHEHFPDIFMQALLV